MLDTKALFHEAWDDECARHLADRRAEFEKKFTPGPASDCWEWASSYRGGGYGHFYIFGRMEAAHRVAYQFYVGAIPAGLVVDHLCRNRGCVNPSHLEAVSQGENIRRGIRGELRRAEAALITECPQGHPYDDENTYLHPRGQRICRACRAESNRKSRRKRKEGGQRVV